jgi:ABC-type amino acid transport substrate-binding protein
LITIPYHRVGLTGKVTLTVTAISKDGSSVTSDPQTLEIYRDSIERIKATGVIIVGIHADDNPGVFCYNSPDAGYTGFDIDLSREIATKLKQKYGLSRLEPKFVFYHWPELLDEPAKHSVDFIIASISQTPEREQKYGLQFSRPYYATRVGLIRQSASNSQPVKYADLLRLRVAANRFTTASVFADSLKLRVTKADTKQEVFALLADRRVDGIIYDYVRSLSEASARGWQASEIETIPVRLRPKPEEYAIAFAAGNDELRSNVDYILSGIDTEQMIRQRINKYNSLANE